MGLFDFFKRKKAEVSVQMNMHISSTSDVVPAEVRIMSAYPSKNGQLYPHELLVLDYADTYYTQDNTYQNFWWTRYGVKDVDAVLQALLRRGFITIAPVTTTLRKTPVADLRQVLESHGLDFKGKKEILIQRIIDEIPYAELNKLFPNRLYMRTEMGEAELKAEPYIPYIHRHSIENLDIWSLNKLVYQSPSYLPYRDVIWGYLNRRSMEHFAAHNLGLYRNCRLSMATFLGEEGRTKGELEMLAEVVFFDLTGAENNYNPEYLYIIASHFFPYEHSLATVAPKIIQRIFDCQEKLQLTDEALRELLENRMEKLTTPLQLFEISECVDIVFYEHAKDTESLEKVYQLAEKRFHARHPSLKPNPFH